MGGEVPKQTEFSINPRKLSIVYKSFSYRSEALAGQSIKRDHKSQNQCYNPVLYLGLPFGPKKTGKISIFIEDLSKNIVFFGTEGKP